MLSFFINPIGVSGTINFRPRRPGKEAPLPLGMEKEEEEEEFT